MSKKDHTCPKCGPTYNTVEFTNIDPEMDGKYCMRCILTVVNKSIPKVKKNKSRSYKRKKPTTKHRDGGFKLDVR